MKIAPDFSFQGLSMFPSIWLVLIKATRKNESVYHVTKTGHVKAKSFTSPVLDIPSRLHKDHPHPSPLRDYLKTKKWHIYECEFECWTHGPIALRENGEKLAWEDLNRVVMVASYHAEYLIAAQGHDVVMSHKPITLKNEELESLAHRLSRDFLADIKPAYT